MRLRFSASTYTLFVNFYATYLKHCMLKNNFIRVNLLAITTLAYSTDFHNICGG